MKPTGNLMTQGRGGIIYRRPGPPPIPQPIQNVQQPQPSRIVHEIEAREQESSKMLVILDSGEQRLITFTLPRKTCTVQELLEQVDIRLDKDSDIECIANPGGQIDYIVKVGQNRNQRGTDPAILTKHAENAIRQRQVQQQQLAQNQRMVQINQQKPPVSAPPSQIQTVQQNSQPAAPKTPDPKLPAPKYLNGFMAVCTACGATGLDHAKCERCHRIFTEAPKSIRMQENVQAVRQISTPPSTTLIATKILDKKDHLEALQKKHQLNLSDQQRKVVLTPGTAGRGARGGAVNGRGRGRGRGKVEEPVIVMLSSDDEADASDSTNVSKNSGNGSAKKLDSSAPVRKPYEPIIVEDTVPGEFRLF
jgi:hypothetical protein